MPKKVSAKTEAEYDRLKHFFKIVWLHELEINPKRKESITDWSDPIKVGEEWEKKYSKAKLLSGLKQAVNDMIYDIMSFMKPEQRKELERRLIAEKAPSLNEMLGKYYNKIRKIIERGRIRTETEYYLVKELAIDMDSDMLTEAEHAKIQKIFYDYEFK